MKKHKNLWAPWRLEYIKTPSSDKCIICEKANSDKDDENYIIQRGEYSFSFLNIYPYTNGHVMIAPFRHVSKFRQLEHKEILEMMNFTKNIQKKLEQKFNSEGFNIGFNEGKIAGAGIHEHIHLHIVPRWEGDTNFMPVIANTKIISESLDSVYKRLKQ